MINLAEAEKSALAAVDEHELIDLIDQALQKEHSRDLHRLPLSNCGPFVAKKPHYFGESLRKFRESKSAKKREETRFQARQAGSDLVSALASMKHRMEIEEQEGQFFHIDDHISWPHHFSRKMQVGVSYRWRRTVEDPWIHGNITFHHEAHSRPDFTLPRPKRKPSAAKQEQDLQDELSRTWEHLMRLALFSVKDYFRDRGDGSKIPSSFRAVTNQHAPELNNHSANFWQEKS